MKWFIEALKKYAVFTGRAQRKEYWMFALISTLIAFPLLFIDLATGGPAFLSSLYCLALFLPSLAVSVRRLHDIGKSGWWITINMVPFLGAMIYLIYLITDSMDEGNPYGPNPKTAAA